MLAEEFAQGEHFIALGGDNLWSAADIKAVCKDDGFCYVCGLKHKHPEKYGVLQKDKDYLNAIIEKPKSHLGNHINTGLYKFTPKIFDALNNISISPRGEYELTDAVNILAEKKKVKVLSIKHYWKDLGCFDDVHVMEDFIKKNRW